MSRRPTIWSSIRQTIGRGVRETGQALDRLGVKLHMFATTLYDFYDEAVIYEDYFSNHRNIFPLPYSGKPLLSSGNTDKNKDSISFIAPCSTLVGSVILKNNVSIWYGAVLRADSCLNSESFYKDYSKLEKERLELLEQQQQQQQKEEHERLLSSTEQQSAGVVPISSQSTAESVDINTITTDNTSNDNSLEVRKDDDTNNTVVSVVDGSTSNFKEISAFYKSRKDNVTNEDVLTEEVIKQNNKFHHQRVLDTIQDKVELWELDFNRYDELRSDKNAKINRTKKFLYGGAIYINDNTNVQDNVVITSAVDHCIIGKNVTIGHCAQIHSSIIGNNCLIGIGSIIQPRCYIGNNVYVGAGTIVPTGTTLDDNTMYIGNPARKVRVISTEVQEKITYQSNEYIKLGIQHRTERLQNGIGDYSTPITVDAYIDNRNKIDTYNDLLYNKTEQYLTSINAVHEYNDIQKWLGNDPIEIIDDISPDSNNKRKQEKIKYPYLQQQQEQLELEQEQQEQQEQQLDNQVKTYEKNKISNNDTIIMDRIGPNMYEQQQKSTQYFTSATSQQKKRTTSTGTTTTSTTTTKQPKRTQEELEERHARQHIIKKGKKKVIVKIPS